MNIQHLSIIKRLFKDYTIKHVNKILTAIIFSILIASTSAIAYLLDPAIENFINQDETLMYLIPLAIIVFFTKGMLCILQKQS